MNQLHPSRQRNDQILDSRHHWVDIQSVRNRYSNGRVFRNGETFDSPCGDRSLVECEMLALKPTLPTLPTLPPSPRRVQKTQRLDKFAKLPITLHAKLLHRMQKTQPNADGDYVFNNRGRETGDAVKFWKRVLEKKLPLRIEPLGEFELGPVCRVHKHQCIDARSLDVFEGDTESKILKDLIRNGKRVIGRKTRILHTFWGPLMGVKPSTARIYAHVFGKDGTIVVGFPPGKPLGLDVLYSLEHFFYSIAHFLKLRQ